MRSSHVKPEPMPLAALRPAARRAEPVAAFRHAALARWCLPLAWLAVMSLGCSSTLTTIALRDAMLQIAELGRRSDTDKTEIAEDEPAVDEDPVELLSLEEALESAITRLAAVGRLDAAARQMLLETLESTSQQDWPVVIESFAVSLEEQAADETAREQLAKQLAEGLEAADTAAAEEVTEQFADDDATPATEAFTEATAQQDAGAASQEAVAEAALADAAPATSDVSVSEAPSSDVAGTDAAGSGPSAASSAQTTVDATTTTPTVVDTPPGDTSPMAAAEAVAASDLVAAAPADVMSTRETAVEYTAARTSQLTQEPDLVERVTTAIRELPVADEPTASPEETMQRLEAALAEARRQAPLRIGNPCFAWRVLGWGDVDCCEAACFVPGQSVIVYFEVENLTTTAGTAGHASQLDTELSLVNTSGQCLHRWEFEPLVENRTSPRRDYFARYILTLPETIQPGPLRLEMTVRDLAGHKSADVALPLEVTAAPARPVEQVAGEATLVR